MSKSGLSTFSAPKGIPDYTPPQSAEFVAVRDGQGRVLVRRETLDDMFALDTGLPAAAEGETR